MKLHEITIAGDFLTTTVTSKGNGFENPIRKKEQSNMKDHESMGNSEVTFSNWDISRYQCYSAQPPRWKMVTSICEGVLLHLHLFFDQFDPLVGGLNVP